MIRVSAPSRLHFGPFSLPAAGPSAPPWPDRDGQPNLPGRSFGGVGLMVQRPGIVVTAAAAPAWSADGPLAARALAYAQRIAAALALDRPCRIVVENAPPEHVGLGTGTQLGLAVAAAVTRAAGRTDLAAADLAQHLGRGQRSALGIHGFAQGGFLVEPGKRAADAIAPLAARLPFPPDWAILLVVPRDLRGTHGPSEAAAFRDLGSLAKDVRRTEALCRLVLLGMVPALIERDLDGFGEAVYDFNRRAGEMFHPWQGGLYAHPRIAALVETLRSAGVRGVGQSSWGPAVYAVVPQEQAGALGAWLVGKGECSPDEAIVTGAANTGARVEMA